MRVIYGRERIAFLLRVCDHDVGLGAPLLYYTAMARQAAESERVRKNVPIGAQYSISTHRDFDEGKIL